MQKLKIGAAENCRKMLVFRILRNAKDKIQSETNIMKNVTNSVIITGVLCTEPTFSHEVYGEKFFDSFVKVKRLSGMDDVLPVSVSEHLLKPFVQIGAEVTIVGQFRSYNKLEDGRSKLMLTVFARDVLPSSEEESPNQVQLCGYVCKPPIYRTTPFSREICDLLIAVNRQYGKSDYIPCIVWGNNARFAGNLPVGSRLNLVGRIQSREYQKHLPDCSVITKVAYEVSVSSISVCTEDLSDSDTPAI